MLCRSKPQHLQELHTIIYQSIDLNTGKLHERLDHLTAVRFKQSLAAADECLQTWWHKIYAACAVIVSRAFAPRQAHLDHFAELSTEDRQAH